MIEKILVYLLVINLFTFVIYGWDKSKARRGSYRISERTLLLLAALGGSIGAYLGMHLFHHKTRKKKFAIGVPGIFVLQVFLLGFIYMKMFQ